MELRSAALQVLCDADPQTQVLAVHTLWREREQLTLETAAVMQAPGVQLPGRPAKPELKPPQHVPSRSVYTPQGLAGLVHSICHIEYNAIHLALDAIWRFAGLPEAYYRDWLKVAYEESTHFELLCGLLRDMGYCYGDFAAHDGLWQMCEKTDKPVIASGGISSLQDLEVLRELTSLGVEGAIVGKALYARAFTLEEAIAVAGPQR